ncbi:MAG: PD40 domain-containing protein [Solirubrobacterales bacterium]|nr:PD40 domain-containing protein [Solirubrobacterales bacterium]
MSFKGGVLKALLLAAFTTLAVTVAGASATVPGKNGLLLVSGYLQGGINGSTGHVFTETTAGKSKELLGALDQSYSDPAVSPNGKQIVYSVYPGYQMMLGPFSNPLKAKAITAPEDDVINQEPVFSPDGKSIYFSKKYLLSSGVFWHLKRYSLKTRKTTSFKVDTKMDWGLSDVSPNGRYLAYSRGGDEVPTRIRLLDTRSGKSHTVATKASALSPAFSPDGKWLAYTAQFGDGWEVVKSRLDGKGVKRLTHTGAVNIAPHFSPDGKQIAFTQGTDEDRKIGILTLRTGKVRYIKAPARYAEVQQWLRK